MKYKIIFLLILAYFFKHSFSQEKGSILIGISSDSNSNIINHSEIRDNLINHFGYKIVKAEICPKHSLIHIVINLNSNNHIESPEIINYLQQTYPNFNFLDKVISQNFDDLNCKWK